MNEAPGAGGTTPAEISRQESHDQATAAAMIAPGRDSPDPGTRRSRLLAKVATLALVGTVMVMQQLGAVAKSPRAETTDTIVAPSQGDQFTLISGMMVKLANAMKGLSGGKLDAMNASQFVTSIRDNAQTPVEKVRAAIACAEIEGANTLEKHLDAISPAPEYPGVEEDMSALRMLAAGGADALSQAQRGALVERHGYFGRLALALGLPDTDPARQPFVKGGFAIIVFVLGLLVLIFFAVIAAAVAFILAMIRFGQGRLRPAFLPPEPGGSVFLEVVAIMAGMFLSLKLVGTIVAAIVTPAGQDPPHWLVNAMLAAQWVVVLALFWPMYRGVSFAELRRRMGWTSGRGVMREIGAGIFAYFAGLPLFAAAVIITLIAMLIFGAIQSAGGRKLPPPENPIFEILGSGSVLTMVLLFVMATVWAPLVEESVFRGALYRHLRSGWGVLLSGVVSAMAFGVMHGYMVLMLLPVMTLGFIFALMREWRGSLIAPMTAHALHNATVLTVLFTALSVMRPE